MNPTHRTIWPLMLAAAVVVAVLRVLAGAQRRSATTDASTPDRPSSTQRARLVSTGERCTVLAHLAEVTIDGLADPVTVALADLECAQPDDNGHHADGQLAALEVGREVWFVPASTLGTARVGTVAEIAEHGAVKLREQSGRVRWADHGTVLAIVGEAVAQVDAVPAGEQPVEPMVAAVRDGVACRRCGEPFRIGATSRPDGFGEHGQLFRCAPACPEPESGR
ncbi:hypothetical protein [Nocardia fluminea]|uniref:hypothetical protein n=1 Tax=Nocardia fluminea TaxID=134984 RepID=UPI00341B2360